MLGLPISERMLISLKKKLITYKKKMADEVEAKGEKLLKVGYKNYLAK